MLEPFLRVAPRCPVPKVLKVPKNSWATGRALCFKLCLHFFNFLVFSVWSSVCYFLKASSWAPSAGYKKNNEPLLAIFGPRTAPLFKVPSPKSTFCARIYRIKLKLSVKFTVLIRVRSFEIERSSLGSPENGTPNHATTQSPCLGRLEQRRSTCDGPQQQDGRWHRGSQRDTRMGHESSRSGV
jgi:hypothetical protein